MITLSSFQAHKKLNIMKYANQLYQALNHQGKVLQLALQ